MQQSKSLDSKPKFFNGSPPVSLKDNFSKQNLPKEINSSVDGSSIWPHESEVCQ